jgi:hypothetical protein
MSQDFDSQLALALELSRKLQEEEKKRRQNRLRESRNNNNNNNNTNSTNNETDEGGLESKLHQIEFKPETYGNCLHKVQKEDLLLLLVK